MIHLGGRWHMAVDATSGGMQQQHNLIMVGRKEKREGRHAMEDAHRSLTEA